MKFPRLSPLILALGLLAAGAASASAQTKIGLVDLRKVFDSYYKTKEADVKIREEADGLKKTAEGMIEDYKSANEEYKSLMEAANSPALAAEEKQRRRKSAEDKLQEIRQLEIQIQRYDEQSKATLAERQRRMRDQLLKEIRERVVAQSKAAGYSLVLDTAALSINQTPIVLFTNNETDFTDNLLKELNATAPAGFVPPTTTP
jgi:outer membrane protein